MRASLVRRSRLPASALLLGVLALTPAVTAQSFLRGDVNSDGSVDVADAVTGLGALFLGVAEPLLCRDAMDANDDGALDIGDPLRSLLYLFAGGALLPPPFPECGEDPTEDTLDCDGAAGCTDCFTQDDLDLIVQGNLPDALCLESPFLTTSILIYDIAVCPAGDTLCGNGRSGCAFFVDSLTGELDVTERTVTLHVIGRIDILPVVISPLAGADVLCDVKVDVDGFILVPFVTRPLADGRAEVLFIDPPEVDVENTSIVFASNDPDPPSLCSTFLGLQDNFVDIVIEELSGQLDEAVSGVANDLVGTIICDG